MKFNLLLFFGLFTLQIHAQKNIISASDASAPLHALQPDYPTPYKIPTKADVHLLIDRVFSYLETATPTTMVEKSTSLPSRQYSDETVFSKGDFRPISYEWGVTYSGMLALHHITGNAKYKQYVFGRLSMINEAIPAARDFHLSKSDKPHILRGLIAPKALDDIGAMAMAVLKAKQAGFPQDISFITQRASDFILKEEHRLSDRTLVRIRPLKNTIWLDDLYMAIPALLQLGKSKGQMHYFNEAVFQFNAYHKRMFNPTLNVFMHGYLDGANEHPEFHWARANGWALLTMTEMLEFLPKNHPGRQFVLAQYKRQVRGLTAFQDRTGFWHQLLDRNDSYLETSATAIYAYCIAKGINSGWLDVKIHSPAAILAWNAVSTRINEKGQVEGTCVGTGLAWDPAFYFFRPISPFAAHGYGPFLLAGSAMLELISKHSYEINDSAIHLK